METEITAIVNVFRRGHVLDSQIEAIKNQSIPPKCIFILNNGNKEIDLTKYKNDSLFKVFDNNFNSGVWSRFIISVLADTKYVCIFDDDTIPGNNWFMNCVNSMNQREALYGTIGVIFKDENKYVGLKRYGWGGNNNSIMPVDIVGHSWFFKKEWMSYFSRETPQINEMFCNGEDIHFSYMLQKYANIPTCVPPHPSHDLSLFGSIPNTAWEYGCDGNSGSNNEFSNFDITFNEYRKRGFKILKNRENANSVDDLKYFMNKIQCREPFALIRPCDGEYIVMQNETLTNIDNWTFQQNGKLCDDLKNAVNIASNKGCYIGIPCGSCNLKMANWYVKEFNINPYYTTFANVFVNKNWKQWTSFLINEKIPFIFVGSNKLPDIFMTHEHINIPLYLVNEWDSSGHEYLANILTKVKKYKNTIFMFSCGPISKIMIAHAWKEHPYNIYLDIGSSLDLYSKGSTNREYAMEGSELSKLECNFDSSVIQL